jgi:hypothetical protein
MNYHPENQGIANQQSLASRQTVGLATSDWLASFEQQQRAASEQYQREAAAKRQRDDEAFRKICKDMDDFWKSPTGIACEIMQLVAVALPILVPAAIVLMMLNHASSR